MFPVARNILSMFSSSSMRSSRSWFSRWEPIGDWTPPDPLLLLLNLRFSSIGSGSCYAEAISNELNRCCGDGCVSRFYFDTIALALLFLELLPCFMADALFLSGLLDRLSLPLSLISICLVIALPTASMSSFSSISACYFDATIFFTFSVYLCTFWILLTSFLSRLVHFFTLAWIKAWSCCYCWWIYFKKNKGRSASSSSCLIISRSSFDLVSSKCCCMKSYMLKLCRGDPVGAEYII